MRKTNTLEEHGKQLVKSSCERVFNTFKTKIFFEEITNERMGEIWNLHRKIGFDNLIYYFKGNRNPKIYIFKYTITIW